MKKTILSRLIRINLQRNKRQKDFNGSKLDPLFSEILFREYDVDSLSDKEFISLQEIFNETIDSLESFSFTKNRVLETWNDDYLNFRLNILKQNIFQTILDPYKETNHKNSIITSSLDGESLFLFLEEIISLQALIANKVPVNKKIQLDAIFDLI